MKKWQPWLAASLVLAAGAALADASDWTVRTLVRGTRIQSTNGIDVGPDGELYVATVFGREIAVVDRHSGAVIERLGPDLGLETPDDLVFGPDGLLYWTEPFTGKVGRLESDGAVTTVAQLPLGAGPLAFNAEGRLFVAVAIFNDALYEVDPSGVEPPRLVAAGLGNLNGFAFGPDGLLYSPQGATLSVVKIDVDAGTVESAATGFLFVASVAFDSRGRLYVNDAGAGEIVRIDLATGVREVFATLPTGVDNITFDDHDHLFATQLIDSSITEVRPDGQVRLIHRPGMSIPGGLATVPAGRSGRHDEIWIADFFSLRAFGDASGRQLRELRSVPQVGVRTIPNTVAIDSDRLVLSSWLGNSVQVVDRASGDPLLTRFDFAIPLNAIVFQGDLVVAELVTGSVVATPQQAPPAPRTVLASGLLVPVGLAARADDLWVTDQLAGALLQVVAGGQVLAPPRLVASGLALPEGLAVLPDGDLAVVEAGAGRVSRVDLASGAVSTIADGLELGTGPPPLAAPPTWHFNGVAVGSAGALYVTGDTANVIYKLQHRGR